MSSRQALLLYSNNDTTASEKGSLSDYEKIEI